jgi:hypothetical protein
MGVAPELQRMIFKGKQLKDDKSLPDYSKNIIKFKKKLF